MEGSKRANSDGVWYVLLSSLLLGVGFVALVWVTMDATWILGIALLMPGITLLGLLPYARILDVTPFPMLVANAGVYSLFSFVALQAVAWLNRDVNFRRITRIVAITACIVTVVGWGLTRLMLSSAPPD